MGLELRTALDKAQLVDPDIEVPPGGGRRVFLSHRAGRRVPGVGEHRLALLDL